MRPISTSSGSDRLETKNQAQDAEDDEDHHTARQAQRRDQHLADGPAQQPAAARLVEVVKAAAGADQLESGQEQQE